jgi:P-type Cu+ transporter
MDQRERIETSILGDQAEGRATDPATQERERDHVFSRVEAARIIVVALAAAAVWFCVREPLPRVSLIGVLGVLIDGWSIFKEAAENAATRRMTMELSMSIPVIGAAGISQFFTALTITLFVLVAEVLERITVSHGRRAISTLIAAISQALAHFPHGRVDAQTVHEENQGRPMRHFVRA